MLFFPNQQLHTLSLLSPTPKSCVHTPPLLPSPAPLRCRILVCQEWKTMTAAPPSRSTAVAPLRTLPPRH